MSHLRIRPAWLDGSGSGGGGAMVVFEGWVICSLLFLFWLDAAVCFVGCVEEAE